MTSTLQKHFELVAFDSQLRLAWQTAPGDIYNHGTFTALHLARNRWILINPDSETIQQLSSQVGIGSCSLSDISGKWTAFPLSETQLARALSAGAPVEEYMRDRSCATCHVFDCPALIARDGQSYRFWIQSSFADSFADVVTYCSSRFSK